MAINKKLIHFLKKENFLNEVANGNILDNSIVFIKDTKEIWTHGTYYGFRTHSHTYTPSGSVKSTFTGTAHNHTFTGTAHNHTFTGTEVTSEGPSKTASVYSITGVGSLPSCTFPTVILPVVKLPVITMPTCTLPSTTIEYSNGELSITHNAGSYSNGSVTAGSVTNGSVTAGSFSAGSLPTRSSVTVASSDHTHDVTATGTIANTTATGTIANTTATGTVASTFTGTSGNATTIN